MKLSINRFANSLLIKFCGLTVLLIGMLVPVCSAATTFHGIDEHWGTAVEGIQLSLSPVKGREKEYVVAFRSESGGILDLGNQLGRQPLPGGISLVLTDSQDKSQELVPNSAIMNSGAAWSNIVPLGAGRFYGIPVSLDSYAAWMSGHVPPGHYKLRAQFVSTGGTYKEPHDLLLSLWKGTVSSAEIPLDVK